MTSGRVGFEKTRQLLGRKCRPSKHADVRHCGFGDLPCSAHLAAFGGQRDGKSPLRLGKQCGIVSPDRLASNERLFEIPHGITEATRVERDRTERDERIGPSRIIGSRELQSSLCVGLGQDIVAGGFRKPSDVVVQSERVGWGAFSEFVERLQVRLQTRDMVAEFEFESRTHQQPGEALRVPNRMHRPKHFIRDDRPR